MLSSCLISYWVEIHIQTHTGTHFHMYTGVYYFLFVQAICCQRFYEWEKVHWKCQVTLVHFMALAESPLSLFEKTFCYITLLDPLFHTYRETLTWYTNTHTGFELTSPHTRSFFLFFQFLFALMHQFKLFSKYLVEPTIVFVD